MSRIVRPRKLTTEEKVVVQDYLLRKREGVLTALRTAAAARKIDPTSTLALNYVYWKNADQFLRFLLWHAGYRGLVRPQETGEEP